MKIVILVSHDLEYRQKLAVLLQNQFGFSHCIEAESLSEACQQTNADLLLIDLAVPDAEDELHWGGLKFCHPTALVAILFDGQYSRSLKLAFIAGATSYIPKNINDETLALRLRDTAKGVKIIPDVGFFERLQAIETDAQLALRIPNVSSHTLDELTPGEQDILKLLAKGMSNKEIAAQLQLSERTVRNHLSEIFSKLELGNRTQAALWAWQQGLGRE